MLYDLAMLHVLVLRTNYDYLFSTLKREAWLNVLVLKTNYDYFRQSCYPGQLIHFPLCDFPFGFPSYSHCHRIFLFMSITFIVVLGHIDPGCKHLY